MKLQLLQEGINNESVLRTKGVKKITIDGITSEYPIYRIRLDNLYYNDQNDRIATWISKYKSENGENALDNISREEYNKIIHDFIQESDPERLNKTQKNIKSVGQRECGIVLNDGRIIDGNRRYTCLRNLSEESEAFNYFEAVILERDIKNSAKQIKMLELQVQLGVDQIVDYNPIEKLVGLYRDVEETKLLTIKEYATSCNQKQSEVEKDLEVAKLIVEFLETINASGKYHIARELKLDGPIKELHGILNKITDEDKKQGIKMVVFAAFMTRPEKDMTRFVRSIGNICKSNEMVDSFLEEGVAVAENVFEDLPDNLTEDDISNVRKNEEVKENLKDIKEKFTDRLAAKETRDKPAVLLDKVVNNLENIDVRLVSMLDFDKTKEIKTYIEDIERLLKDIKEALNV